jgi:hypothetical protein
MEGIIPRNTLFLNAEQVVETEAYSPRRGSLGKPGGAGKQAWVAARARHGPLQGPSRE